MRKTKLLWHKITHWEYWPYQIVYLPVYFQYGYYALRMRSFFFFSLANTGFSNGGFFTTSKKEIYDTIPKKYYPKTLLFEPNTLYETILESIQKEEISFPIIVKPDVGFRGTAVKKIETEQELKNTLSSITYLFLVQELVTYSNEIGLFYVKLPNENQGKITGIVSKEFLTVIGNGKATIKALLLENPRFAFQLETLINNPKIDLNHIPAEGEKVTLVPFGNHCRGAKFIDESHLISEQLTTSFNSIFNQINGFNYGRIDIMFHNFSDLENGKHFKIIEINGVISEPTHMYDPKHSLFFGWKELIRHYNYLYKIAKFEGKKGKKPIAHSIGKKEFKKHFEHVRIISK
jgi:hypothetical protein